MTRIDFNKLYEEMDRNKRNMDKADIYISIAERCKKAYYERGSRLAYAVNQWACKKANRLLNEAIDSFNKRLSESMKK